MNDDLKWLAENVHEWEDGASCAYIEDGKTRWVFGAYFWPHKIVVTQPEWQAARDELSGKPGWELAPGWARIRVQSSIGNWFFGDYKDAKPRGESEWVAVGGSRWSNPFRGRVLGNWRNTLERRPEAVGTEAAAQIRAATACSLREFALSQIRAAVDCTITDDDVREVFINLITELDDEALAGVAGRVVK